jgi:DNA-binding transcriptional LysR family regulator
MASLNAYAAYVAVIECGSLTAAARRLGRSLQAVSRLLADLEKALGVQLSLARRGAADPPLPESVSTSASAPCWPTSTSRATRSWLPR